MLTVVLVLIVVGVGLYLLNRYVSAYIDRRILLLINVFVVICCVVWVLKQCGIDLMAYLQAIGTPHR